MRFFALFLKTDLYSQLLTAKDYMFSTLKGISCGGFV